MTIGPGRRAPESTFLAAATLTSLFGATTVRGFPGRVAEALPVAKVLDLLDRDGTLYGETGGAAVEDAGGRTGEGGERR